MTRRFLRGKRVWESWFYRPVPAIPDEKGFVMRCAIRVLHFLYVERGIVTNIRFGHLWYNYHETLRIILRYAGFRCKKQRKRKNKKNVLPQPLPPSGKGPRRRDQERLVAYNRRHSPSLVRRGAVREPPSRRGVIPPPGEALYVPPHRRNADTMRNLMDVCPECGTRYRNLTRLMFQDYRPLPQYWQRQRRILSGESFQPANEHEERVAFRESQTRRVCNCTIPDGGADFDGRFHYQPRPVEDDDDYFSSLASDLGL